MRAKQPNESWIYKEIAKLDGMAVVNLQEPSKGDLERIYFAYIEATDKLAEVTKERDEFQERFQQECKDHCDDGKKATAAIVDLNSELDAIKLWQTKAREFIKSVRDDARKTLDIIDKARAFQESDK